MRPVTLADGSGLPKSAVVVSGCPFQAPDAQNSCLANSDERVWQPETLRMTLQMSQNEPFMGVLSILTRMLRICDLSI